MFYRMLSELSLLLFGTVATVLRVSSSVEIVLAVRNAPVV